MTNTRKATFAVAFLAPLFVLATPSLASAANDDGQNFRSTQTNTTRDGVSRTNTDSCMGSNGEVSYQRTTQTAGVNGRTTRTVNSGNAACDGTVTAASTGDNAKNNQQFSDSQTSTTNKGVTHRSVESCMGPNDTVGYERNTQTASANGRSSRTVNSGDANCSGNAQPAAQTDPAAAPAANAADAGTSAAAPLIVINPAPLSR